MPQAVNSELLLYADDTCLIYMGKNIQKIEEQLNSDFTSLCEWFIDNKLSVHFGEEKTKSILFGTKRQLKDQRDLNLKYGDIEIKQHCRVTYLGCILDNILSGEHMAAKVLNTVNNRLKFLYRKQKFLSLSLRRLLCNALIQPHFDYACVAWYPLLNKRQSKRIQIAQNTPKKVLNNAFAPTSLNFLIKCLLNTQQKYSTHPPQYTIHVEQHKS